MRHYTCTFASFDHLEDWLETINLDHASDTLVQLFCGILDQEELIIDIVQHIEQKIPNVTVIGASTCGELINSKMKEHSIVISVSVFENTFLQSYFAISSDSYLLGEKVAQEIVSEHTKAVIIFADGILCNGDALLRGFSQNALHKDLVVSGGLAGDNNKFAKTFMISQKNIFSGGVVAVALQSETLIVHTSYNLSWRAIGLPMRVTSARDNRVYEIDHKPAVEVYKEFLGDGIVENMPDSAIEFPLIYLHKGVEVARTMIAKEEDCIVYAGEIPQDTDVRFGVASPKMLKARREEMYKLNASRPIEAIYVYSCVARKAFLEKEIESEIKPLSDISPLAGFFTYGELYTTQNDFQMLNITTTVLSLSEEKQTGYKYQKDILDQERVSLSTSGLIHLVEKTIATLEDESFVRQDIIAQLNQYKKAIYKSYILSVADLKGVIIDVNDRFVEISGYSREELIGKPHNIVRHPDVSSKIFADMWATIKAKKIWQGVLKNLRKDGTTYHVNATVFPLLDRENNITSYISIRDDITEIKNQKYRAEAILNAQSSIVLLSSKIDDLFHVKELNKKFFDLFEYQDIKDFLSKHSCLSELFIEKNGYLKRDMDGESWLDYAIKHEKNTNLVLMRDKCDKLHIFSLRSQNIFLENGEFVISTFTDVTELENARVQAQAAEKTKSAFLSTMSHELRTPLNSVIGFSQILMKKTDMQPQQMRTFIEKINISGTHLLNLVNNILDFSKIESDKMDVKAQVMSLEALILNTLTILETTIQKKKLQVILNGIEHVEVHGDEQLLKQLFLNILSNAVKFTPEEKKITVRYDRDELYHIISICDQGHGIPKDQIQGIFDPFSQVREHQNESIKGTGLGLAISKKIAQLHHGKIELQSTFGEGACFYIYLSIKTQG